MITENRTARADEQQLNKSAVHILFSENASGGARSGNKNVDRAEAQQRFCGGMHNLSMTRPNSTAKLR